VLLGRAHQPGRQTMSATNPLELRICPFPHERPLPVEQTASHSERASSYQSFLSARQVERMNRRRRRVVRSSGRKWSGCGLLRSGSCLGVLLWTLALSVWTAASERLDISLEDARPVFRWANLVGTAYVVEATTDLADPSWETRATVTTDSPEAVWSDDGLPDVERHYRVARAADPTTFQSLQQALQRARSNQGITGAAAAVVLADRTLWLGTSGYSHGDAETPSRRQPAAPAHPESLGPNSEFSILEHCVPQRLDRLPWFVRDLRGRSSLLLARCRCSRSRWFYAVNSRALSPVT